MQKILKNFETIKQLKQTKEENNQKIDCQLFPNQSLIIGDLSQKELSGMYKFVYKDKFYLWGNIKKDQIQELSIYWRDDLHFEGKLLCQQDKLEGFIFYSGLFQVQIDRNSKFEDFNDSTIYMQDDRLGQLHIKITEKDKHKILRVVYQHQCLLKIKNKKDKEEVVLCFYQYSEQFGKKSSINIIKPFKFIKKLYKNKTKTKEKNLDFYRGLYMKKQKIGNEFYTTSITNMKGIKIQFSKGNIVQEYSIPMFQKCLQLGLTQNTQYNKENECILNINADYNPVESEFQQDRTMCPINIQQLKYISDINIKGFQQQQFNFDKIIQRLCERYVLMKEVAQPLFYTDNEEEELDSETQSNIICCSDEYLNEIQILQSNKSSEENIPKSDQSLGDLQSSQQVQSDEILLSQQDFSRKKEFEKSSFENQPENNISCIEYKEDSKSNFSEKRDKYRQDQAYHTRFKNYQKNKRNKKFIILSIFRCYQFSLKLKFQRGLFEDDKLVGQCVEILSNYYYSGMFQNGYRDGCGYLVEKDSTNQGDWFQFGDFQNNKKCGKFIIQRNSALQKVIIENDKYYEVPKRQKYLGVYRKFYNHKSKDDVLIEGQNFEFYGTFFRTRQLQIENYRQWVYHGIIMLTFEVYQQQKCFTFA